MRNIILILYEVFLFLISLDIQQKKNVEINKYMIMKKALFKDTGQSEEGRELRKREKQFK